jgi:NADH pyrophosphatase NudC (nudix superfamily)
MTDNKRAADDAEREQLELIVRCDPTWLLMDVKNNTLFDAALLEKVFELAKEQSRAALSSRADGGKDSSDAEKMVRYCPGCGSIGTVEAKYRGCCPDGSDARMVPEKFAQQCRDTFKLAIAAIAKEKK